MLWCVTSTSRYVELVNVHRGVRKQKLVNRDEHTKIENGTWKGGSCVQIKRREDPTHWLPLLWRVVSITSSWHLSNTRSRCASSLNELAGDSRRATMIYLRLASSISQPMFTGIAPGTYGPASTQHGNQQRSPMHATPVTIPAGIHPSIREI